MPGYKTVIKPAVVPGIEPVPVAAPDIRPRVVHPAEVVVLPLELLEPVQTRPCLEVSFSKLIMLMLSNKTNQIINNQHLRWLQRVASPKQSAPRPLSWRPQSGKRESCPGRSLGVPGGEPKRFWRPPPKRPPPPPKRPPPPPPPLLGLPPPPPLLGLPPPPPRKGRRMF